MYIEGQVCPNRDDSFEKSIVDLEVKMGDVHLEEHFSHLDMLQATIVSVLNRMIPILDSIMIIDEIEILQYDKRSEIKRFIQKNRNYIFNPDFKNRT